MKVLKIEPEKRPEVKEVESGLSSLQHEVDGYIEVVYPFDDNVGIICNEEGKINGMPLNRALRDEDGNIYDVIAGPFLVVGLTDCDFDSLSDEQISCYSDMFSIPERFYNVNGRIQVVPFEPTPTSASAMSM